MSRRIANGVSPLRDFTTWIRACTEGGQIVLLDDLFRSGATMNAITDVLLGKGKAASVRAFTITRTRSNQ